MFGRAGWYKVEVTASQLLDRCDHQDGGSIDPRVNKQEPTPPAKHEFDLSGANGIAPGPAQVDETTRTIL